MYRAMLTFRFPANMDHTLPVTSLIYYKPRISGIPIVKPRSLVHPDIISLTGRPAVSFYFYSALFYRGLVLPQRLLGDTEKRFVIKRRRD